ncbi:MAG: methylenetetrahydrofolate reductase [Deltaproteobacteria bacterium]|nr:methylenetetrahydrofolate reductase [Deltaproteobacteria bacterium]
MGKLKHKLETSSFVVTAEVTPPKGAGVKKLLKNAERLKPLVDAINITDCQRALVKMSSLASSRVLLDNGIEPVFQLTCRDRNRIALQSDLLGAAALGIPNILCLTGDPVKAGDCPDAKPVFELESVKLLKLITKLQNGIDDNGIKMNAPTRFLMGSAINPTLRGNSNQLTRMSHKIEAGARFFQTQANYDLEDFKAFCLEAKKYNTKILAGILILHSFDSAQYIQENIPGINIPDAILERFKSSKYPLETGIAIAVESMLQLSAVVDGFHVMSIRKEELIATVLENYYAKSDTQTNSTLR